MGVKFIVNTANALVEETKTAEVNRIYKYKRLAEIGPDGKKVKGEQPTIYTIEPPKR